MKASEVLRRYAAKERDFRSADLRGQTFKGHDLSNADFRKADIRGANFTNTNLTAANFTEVKAGVGKRWIVGQLLLLLLLTALVGVMQGMTGWFFIWYFGDNFQPNYNWLANLIPDLFYLMTLLIAMFSPLVAILRQGLTAKGMEKIAGAVTVAGVIAAVAAFASRDAGSYTGENARAVAGVIAGAGAVSIAASIVIAVVGVGIFAVTVARAGAIAVVVVIIVAGILAITVAITVSSAVSVAVAITVPKSGAVLGADAVAVLDAGGSWILGLYTAYRANQGIEKYMLSRQFGIALAALGGTSFSSADLTRANFSHAILNSTNFNPIKEKPTILKWVCWQDAKKLDYARLDNSILSNPAARELVVTRYGYKKSYVDANLRGANLNGVNFTQANLKWADLSEATLHYADLYGADLSEVLALGADFTGANLTGVCLEGWNIDHSTNLEGVNCQYVYLRRNQQERRPSSGDFAPGEFTKLFQEVLSTVDLIFRNGIDWKAFTYSFNKLVLDNEGTELSIQSIENKGDGVVVVRVAVPLDADKAKIHSEFNQNYDLAVKALEAKYHAELKAKDEQITIYRQQSADILEITRLMANRPVSIINENKLMNSSSDQSRNINVGGNLNATGSTFNLGEISGNVTNAINQLPDNPAPKQPSLKELLTQLQGAIEADADLPDADKADLLEQVQNLAQAKQTEEPAQKEGVARKAKKMFEATLKSLPDTAKIVEACGKLLPLILKALGLPA